MSESQSPRADLVFSVVLTLVGAATLFESWRMPRLENLGINPLSAPGVTPALLGAVLTVLGLMLLGRSLGAFAALVEEVLARDGLTTVGPAEHVARTVFALGTGLALEHAVAPDAALDGVLDAVTAALVVPITPQEHR